MHWPLLINLHLRSSRIAAMIDLQTCTNLCQSEMRAYYPVHHLRKFRLQEYDGFLTKTVCEVCLICGVSEAIREISTPVLDGAIFL